MPAYWPTLGGSKVLPNRIIREGINDSRAVNSLSDTGELFYRRLMSAVDDYGRFEVDIELLRGELFKRALDRWPLSRVRDALTEVSHTFTAEGAPLVLLYRAGARQYLQISNFNQRLRAKSSRFPDPGPPPYDGSMLPDDGHASDSCSPSRSRSRSAKSKTTTEAVTEFPKTAAAVCGHFPATDTTFVLQIVDAGMRAYAGVDEPKIPIPTDDVLADAVESSFSQAGKQTSAGLFLRTVPAVITNWSKAGRSEGNGASSHWKKDVIPPGEFS